MKDCIDNKKIYTIRIKYTKSNNSYQDKFEVTEWIDVRDSIYKLNMS